MEQLEIQVPYPFIRARARLSWRELKFGIEQRLLRPRDAIEVALDSLEQGDAGERVAELASASPQEPISELVDRLASKEPQQELLSIQRKWVFLVLAWVFEHRVDFKDPLEIVEKVYADLGYPEQVTPMVRYMPMDGPDLGSKERNEQRLFQRWTDYLKVEAAIYLRSSRAICPS